MDGKRRKRPQRLAAHRPGRIDQHGSERQYREFEVTSPRGQKGTFSYPQRDDVRDQSLVYNPANQRRAMVAGTLDSGKTIVRWPVPPPSDAEVFGEYDAAEAPDDSRTGAPSPRGAARCGRRAGRTACGTLTIHADAAASRTTPPGAVPLYGRRANSCFSPLESGSPRSPRSPRSPAVAKQEGGLAEPNDGAIRRLLAGRTAAALRRIEEHGALEPEGGHPRFASFARTVGRAIGTVDDAALSPARQQIPAEVHVDAGHAVAVFLHSLVRTLSSRGAGDSDAIVAAGDAGIGARLVAKTRRAAPSLEEWQWATRQLEVAGDRLDTLLGRSLPPGARSPSGRNKPRRHIVREKVAPDTQGADDDADPRRELSDEERAAAEAGEGAGEADSERAGENAAPDTQGADDDADPRRELSDEERAAAEAGEGAGEADSERAGQNAAPDTQGADDDADPRRELSDEERAAAEAGEGAGGADSERAGENAAPDTQGADDDADLRRELSDEERAAAEAEAARKERVGVLRQCAAQKLAVAAGAVDVLRGAAARASGGTGGADGAPNPVGAAVLDLVGGVASGRRPGVTASLPIGKGGVRRRVLVRPRNAGARGAAMVVLPEARVKRRGSVAVADQSAHMSADEEHRLLVAVVDTDLAGNVTAWSVGAEELTGVMAHEAIGRPLEERVSEGDGSRLDVRDLVEGLQGMRAKPQQYTLGLLRSGGGTRQAVMSVQPISDGDGRTGLRLAQQTAVMIAGDASGTVTEWNETAERVIGIAAADAIGRALEDALGGGEDGAAGGTVRGVVDRTMAGERVRPCNVVFRGKDGVPVECIVRAISRLGGGDDGGGVTGFELAGVVRVGADLKHLLSLSDGAVFALNRELRITGWNTTASTITSHSEDAVLGVELLPNFIAEDFRAQFRQVLGEALDGKTVLSFTVPRTVNGVYSPLQLNAFPARIDGGAPAGVVLVVQGLAARARLARIWVDPQYAVTEANALMEERYGGSLHGSGRLVLTRDLVYEDAAAAVADAVSSVPTRGMSEPFVLPLRTASGGVREMTVRATARRSLSGRVLRVEISESPDDDGAGGFPAGPTVETDADGIITAFDDAAERVTGKRRADVVGRPVSVLFEDPLAFAAGVDDGAREVLARATADLEREMAALESAAADGLAEEAMREGLRAVEEALAVAASDPLAAAMTRRAAALAGAAADAAVANHDSSTRHAGADGAAPAGAVEDARAGSADMAALAEELDAARDAAGGAAEEAFRRIAAAHERVAACNDAVSRCYRAMTE